MSSVPFDLKAFSRSPFSENFRVSGELERKGSKIECSFHVQGPIDDLQIPERSSQPGIRNYLWEKTCFEIFISPESEERYWEWNFSPSFDWNYFRFKTYRVSLPTHDYEKIAPSLKLWNENGKELTLSAELDLKSLKLQGGLEVGVTAVLEAFNGVKTYWALVHSDSKPNFHLRQSFTLKA